MPQPQKLTDAEIAAIRALQEAATAPGPDNPIWLAPLSLNLVWIETELRPKTVRLTEAGRAYPTSGHASRGSRD
jgi:hypothetical protein